MTKVLVEVDDHMLAKAAARLGTTTKKDTIGKALERAAQGPADAAAANRKWNEWADDVGERLAEVDWDTAWR